MGVPLLRAAGARSRGAPGAPGHGEVQGPSGAPHLVLRSLCSLSLAVEETDNTLTLIIVGVVGGVFGLLILFMLVKRVILFIIKKVQDGK